MKDKNHLEPEPELKGNIHLVTDLDDKEDVNTAI